MSVPNLFWDSCVFLAFIKKQKESYDVDSISQYLDDAKNGKVRIYSSSIANAEVLPSHFESGSMEDFLADYEGAIFTTDANPNITLLSGRLRDLPYRKGNEINRRLGIGDAIMLATCIQAQEAYGVPFEAFHTFDAGGKKGLDGNRSIPILGYEKWCDGFSTQQQELAQKVISLNRCHPKHPSPKML